MLNQNNPTELAEYFSEIQKRFGYDFDFSIESLKTELDKFLNENLNLNEFAQTVLEPMLTSYIGETLCRNYNAEWNGSFRGSLSLNGANYYDSWIDINGNKFWPSHFVESYLNNGKEEKSFSEYISIKITEFE